MAQHLRTVGMAQFVSVGTVIPAFVLWLTFHQPFQPVCGQTADLRSGCGLVNPR